MEDDDEWRDGDKSKTIEDLKTVQKYRPTKTYKNWNYVRKRKRLKQVEIEIETNLRCK